MSNNNQSGLQVCPICRVSIAENGQVNFSDGKPGSRARLYARVCQYTQKPGCINQENELVGEITREDSFESGDDLVMSMNFAITSVVSE